MILRGSQHELFSSLRSKFPQAPACPSELRPQMLAYQLLALFGLATAYNRPGAAILEIGTGHGASAYMLSQAAPHATIVSLTVSDREVDVACTNLARLHCGNVQVMREVSWEFLARVTKRWNLIYVDGDHKHVQRDLLAWKRLRPGGLLLFHDYSPAESAHPSPVVVAALNSFRDELGRPFDVEIVDETQTGMAGWFK